MADIPQISPTVRVPVQIPVHRYLLDHRFEGRAVLPAVEAMQVLAAAVKALRPETDLSVLTGARFDKFLYIASGITQVAAFSDITVYENGAVAAVLLTKTKSKHLAITRIKQHARLCFSPTKPVDSTPAPDWEAVPQKNCRDISPRKIYRDLVPFGPAYRNIQRMLCIGKKGVIAKTGSPAAYATAHPAGHLGSPFPLDAAFHAACVWGQRYARTVAFPVAIESRVIFNPTRPGETYISRILPVQTRPEPLIFDIWLHDENGQLFETICGVHMQDVSAGRLKPPPWIVE